MKILVVGKEGQLAQSLREAGHHHGINLVAVGRPDLDLLDRDSIARAIHHTDPQLVINASAYTSVDRAESEPERAFAINAAGAGWVAELCRHNDVPIIHVSTDYVFDGSNPEPYVEDDRVAPIGVYGQSKLEGEQRVAAANPKHIILRTAWVISPFGNNFLKTMLRLAGSRNEIDVVNDQTGSPTYAPHLAKAILSIARLVHAQAATTQHELWGIFHATAPDEATWYDLAREIFQQSARSGGPNPRVHPIATVDYPTPARRPANSRLDCRKLARVFGLYLPGWRQGVAECVARLCSR